MSGPPGSTAEGGHSALSRRADRFPRPSGRPVHLTVTLTLDALAAFRDDPAVLHGWGAITADWARTLARAARSVTLLVTDPHSGAALGAGHRTYRPRQTLRDQVMVTHPTCIFPGCGTPAARCDLDHRNPFDHQHPDRGGPTSVGNLSPLCRPHHRLKTLGGWSYTRGADHSLTFRSPLGLATRVGPSTPLLPEQVLARGGNRRAGLDPRGQHAPPPF